MVGNPDSASYSARKHSFLDSLCMCVTCSIRNTDSAVLGAMMSAVLTLNARLLLQPNDFLVETPVTVLTPSAYLHNFNCWVRSTRALEKSAPAGDAQCHEEPPKLAWNAYSQTCIRAVHL